MMWRGAAAGVALCVASVLSCGDAVATNAHIVTTPLAFSDLEGWAEDDHARALRIFNQTCDLITAPPWREVCSRAKTAADPRGFFEKNFTPTLIEDGAAALFTGYYEPEIQGSLTPDPAFPHPVYALPPEVQDSTPWLSRAEIVQGGALRGRGLEIAYIADPAELFFMQVQGSGRIRLADGATLRLGYAGKNGHPYRSIGKELVRRGVFDLETITADKIKAWIGANPREGAALLFHNPAYVFFRKLPDLPADQGPIGAMGRSVTALRSLAVDPDFIPLGAPVWVQKHGPSPFRRLMVAQDTGSAIKGAQRADIFYGTGAQAGHIAGAIRDTGRMIVLLPKSMAEASR